MLCEAVAADGDGEGVEIMLDAVLGIGTVTFMAVVVAIDNM